MFNDFCTLVPENNTEKEPYLPPPPTSENALLTSPLKLHSNYPSLEGDTSEACKVKGDVTSGSAALKPVGCDPNKTSMSRS